MVAAVIVLAGIMGFDLIMRLQKYLTIALIIVTVVYIVLTWDHIHLDTLRALPNGGTSAVIGAGVLVMTGFGRRLGQHRRRLLPLPAARRPPRPASSGGRRSAGACRS